MATEKDDVVLVEHADITTKDDKPEDSNPTATSEDKKEKLPEPLQIVSIGSEDDKFAFTFHEDKLNSIMAKVPPGWKVAVISVVGAFRTGKSFLLSWFLTYLHHVNKKASSSEEGDLVDENRKWFETVETIKNDGFHWRGGSERNTTGIWMWSEPHFVKRGGETLAVLLVDSQGMFDNETTMSLTRSIFGLSTLLSSYQIYNVDKRIQEDNLQQLALFSEFARVAVEADTTRPEKAIDEKPFQTIEFLVRDWQHFEDEENYDQMEQEMNEYLEKVISQREAEEMQDTREQISACFDKVTCFGLTHPGMAVIKKNFQGEVSKMDETFLNLLDRYCRRVFHEKNLKPKVIHGREVVAAELGSFIKAYAEMFASGASFPEATTMLEAMSSANNTNAVNLAVTDYKEHMSRISGPKCSNYIRPEALQEDHRQLLAKSLSVFDSIATFGSKRSIEGARKTAIDQINAEFEMFSSINDGRCPWAGIETYAVPASVGLVAYILRSMADFFCSAHSQTCRNSSEMLSHIYAAAFCFMFILAVTKAKQLKDFFQSVVNFAKLFVANGGDGGKAKRD